MALAECIALSKVLEIELAKQEPDSQPTDDLVGDIRYHDCILQACIGCENGQPMLLEQSRLKSAHTH